MKNKRDGILNSAEHEFLEKGYEGTSIDDIVKEVGGSKSTIYAYFRDKSMLFAETLAHVRHELDFSLSRAIRQETDDLGELLVLLGVEFLSTLYSERALHLFRTVIAESKRFPDVARQLIDDGLDLAVARIATAIADALGQKEATDRARRFVGLLCGDLHVRLLLGTEPVPTAEKIVHTAERAAQDFLATTESNGRVPG